MTNVISLHDVRKEYKTPWTTVTALAGVSLELDAGRFYSIIGPSGSGKSSLLHILGCMDAPTSGKVYLNGRDVTGLPEHARTTIRAREIGFIFQAFHLIPILNARENVALPLRFLGAAPHAALKRADECLAQVGLEQRGRHYPAQLSGGERQRVAIARALVKRPAVILADEPTGNLDSQRGREVMEQLRAMGAAQNATVVQVTHNLEMAHFSDAIFKLRDGQLAD